MTINEIHQTLKSSFPTLNGESLDAFVKHSSFVKKKKGTKLITEGNRHHYFYLILSGCVKSYYLKDSKEICAWFGFENEIIGTTSTLNGIASNETIELIEDSEFIRFNIEKIIKLSQTDISISKLLNLFWAQHALFLEERLYQLQFFTSQERYNTLIKYNPELIQRVSVSDIASFLGVSRETLSRIRAKK